MRRFLSALLAILAALVLSQLASGAQNVRFPPRHEQSLATIARAAPLGDCHHAACHAGARVRPCCSTATPAVLLDCTAAAPIFAASEALAAPEDVRRDGTDAPPVTGPPRPPV